MREPWEHRPDHIVAQAAAREASQHETRLERRFSGDEALLETRAALIGRVRVTATRRAMTLHPGALDGEPRSVDFLDRILSDDDGKRLKLRAHGLWSNRKIQPVACRNALLTGP
ncbi:hypothetical protein TrVFT333_005449 [Trichoderma virens FT-333]|nr:hypothetical protein TrVFT333_005449 [Trichoderma virens FT-333]